jgi:hypothetical protein
MQPKDILLSPLAKQGLLGHPGFSTKLFESCVIDIFYSLIPLLSLPSLSMLLLSGVNIALGVE